jgi:hypothetical protein
VNWLACWYVPASHAVQLSAPSDDPIVPGAQSTQVEAPADGSALRPSSHRVQAVRLGAALYEPNGQSVHTVAYPDAENCRAANTAQHKHKTGNECVRSAKGDKTEYG